MRRSILLVAAVLAGAAACDGNDSIQPADRIIATGTYEYEGRYLHPVTVEWDTIRGQLVVEVVTPDSVHGTWRLGGFRRDSVGGYWNENAYVLIAHSNNGQVTLTNRVARFGGISQLLCSLAYRQIVPDEDPITTSGTCDVAFVGP